MRKPSTQDFQFIAGCLALDFINTVGNRLGEPREYLDSADEFNRWAQLAGLLQKHHPLLVSHRELKEIRTVREELYRLFQPLSSGSLLSTSRVTPLNARFTRIAHKRRLRCEQGDVNWEWKMPSHDPDRVLAPILLSAAELLVSGRSHKVRQCQDKTCGWLFLDRSQASRRRWCSMSDCGNRAKALRHYLRKKK
jgi:predicted RNA-binding Zn ribbon-like protein